MSNITINSLPTASTIDGSLDILPIYTASSAATKGISRNTLLNISSQPVGLTDSQVMTNKTLTAPTISSPVLSGTITGTYTIGGTPTFPSSVATLTGSQTLTNKVLTSPTINSPTITNATISADTVSGFTTSNTGTIYGISVTTGTIGSAAIANNAIVTAGIADSAVTPAKLLSGTGTSWAFQSYTPTLTGSSSNPTLGTGGTIVGKYARVGKLVRFQVLITWGSSGTAGGSGSYRISLPVTAINDSFLGGNALTPIGTGVLYQASGPHANITNVVLPTTTYVNLYGFTNLGSGTAVTTLGIYGSSIFIPGVNDIVSFYGEYEAA